MHRGEIAHSSRRLLGLDELLLDSRLRQPHLEDLAVLHIPIAWTAIHCKDAVFLARARALVALAALDRPAARRVLAHASLRAVRDCRRLRGIAHAGLRG